MERITPLSEGGQGFLPSRGRKLSSWMKVVSALPISAGGKKISARPSLVALGKMTQLGSGERRRSQAKLRGRGEKRGQRGRRSTDGCPCYAHECGRRVTGHALSQQRARREAPPSV